MRYLFIFLGLSVCLRAQDLYVPGDLSVNGEADFYGNIDVSGDIGAAHVSSHSAAGYSAFYGRQLGATFTNPSPIYAAVADHGNGSANWFFLGKIGGPDGPVTFSIRADGLLRSAALSGTGDKLLQVDSDGTVLRGTVSSSDLAVLGGSNVFRPTVSGSYTEGIRINDAANSYAVIHLGGNEASGTGPAQWSLIKSVSGNFEIRENGVKLLEMSPSRFSSFVAGVFPRLVADSGSGIASYGTTGAWTGAAVVTDSIEIVNHEGVTTDSSPTLAFHRYGSGGPHFRLDATGSNVLYLESSNHNAAKSPLPYGGGSNAFFSRFHVDGQFSASGNVSIGAVSPGSSSAVPLVIGFDPAISLNSMTFEYRGPSGSTGAMNFALKVPFPYASGVNLNATQPMLDVVKLNDGNTILASNNAGGSMGNVGVGTITPSEKLDVAGNIRVRGKVRVGESGDLSMGAFRADGGLGNPSD